jgi:3-oxoacyl-[acyl-carrier protein] reductase
MVAKSALLEHIAIVTGCARKNGIGRGIAHALARRGADVAVVDVDPVGTRNPGEPDELDTDWHGLESLAAELEKHGTRALPLVGDVGNHDDAERIVGQTLERYGRIDILVNNAAAPHGEDCNWSWEVPEDAYDTVLRVNTKGVFLMSTAVVRHFLEREAPGRIINISSVAGKSGAPKRAAYSASKFAVIGLTQSMARELAPHNITINAICPGMINTPRHASTTAKADDETATLTAALAGIVPRAGTPDDIGNAVALLAEPAAGFINGQSLIVDGGMFMS